MVFPVGTDCASPTFSRPFFSSTHFSEQPIKVLSCE